MTMKTFLVLVSLLPALVAGGKLLDTFNLDLDEALSCRREGEGCRGFPSCCDDLQCYWEEKWKLWNPLQTGVCVTCVAEGLRCQRDTQCCQGYQCDTDGVTDINGFCQRPRREGNVCHRDGMCASEVCDKRHVMQLYGECL